MKKWVGFVLVFVLIAAPGFSTKYSINLNMDYNHGISDYFDATTTFYSFDGRNFRETRENRMGFGFSLGASVEVIERLHVSPEISMKFGHQNYEYTEILETPNEEETELNTFFFTILSGRVSLIYDVFRFKSGWNLNALLALGVNSFSADQGMREEDETYWSVRTGLGATFLELKHFGFRLFGFYEFPLSGDRFTLLGVQAGILYRF